MEQINASREQIVFTGRDSGLGTCIICKEHFTEDSRLIVFDYYFHRKCFYKLARQIMLLKEAKVMVGG